MKKLVVLSFCLIMVFINACNNKPQQKVESIPPLEVDLPSNSEKEKPVSNSIPGHIRSHFKQGSLFLVKRDYQNAIRKFKLAIKLKPDFIQAHYNLGVAYLETKQLGLAIEEWETTIQLDPDYAKAYLSLGYAYEQLSNNDKAVENYEKYLQLNPNDPKAKAISKKIDSIRTHISGQGIVGKIMISGKVDPVSFNAVETGNIFSDNVPVIYTTAEILDAPEETNIKSVWYYLGLKGEEILVNSKEKVVTGPQKMLFELNKPANTPWPTGRYEIRLYVNGKENLSIPFTIVKGEGKPNAKGPNP